MLKAFIIFGMVGEAGLGISLSGNLYKKEVFLQSKHSLQILRKLQIRVLQAATYHVSTPGFWHTDCQTVSFQAAVSLTL